MEDEKTRRREVETVMDGLVYDPGFAVGKPPPSPNPFSPFTSSCPPNPYGYGAKINNSTPSQTGMVYAGRRPSSEVDSVRTPGSTGM